MFEKVFGYILSLRKRKRAQRLEVIHKMSDSEPLEKALAYCSFYAQYPKEEPTVHERMKRNITCKCPDIDGLDNEILRIRDLVLEEEKRNKYYERLPEWGNKNDRPIKLDELLQTSTYAYLDVGAAIKMIGDNLRSIKEGLELPCNEKMKSYYLKKPGVVYREAVNILRQIV